MLKFIFLISILLISWSAIAVAETSPKTSATAGGEFTRQAQTFYKQHLATQAELQNRKRLILKKISNLNLQRQNAPADIKKIREQLNAEQKQLRIVNYDIARHSVETAEFGVQTAQYRLAAARQYLANLEKSSPDLKNKS